MASFGEMIGSSELTLPLMPGRRLVDACGGSAVDGLPLLPLFDNELKRMVLHR